MMKWGRDGSYDGAFFFPRGWPSILSGTCTWPMKAIIAFKSSMRAAVSSPNGERRAAAPDNLNRHGVSPAMRSAMCYVVDSNNHRIQKFDGNGTFICSWGNRGVTEGQFNFPYGIAVDKEGCVYIVDSGNNRIVKYVPTEEEIQRTQQAKTKQQESSTKVPAPRSIVVKPGDTEVT